MKRWLVALLGFGALAATTGLRGDGADEPGLLFYLSGDRGLRADYAAGGTPDPNFASDVVVIPDGAKGAGLQCGHTQLLSYWAPGNVYAERGTISFFWRSREPVGKTPFPVFRVGYADHSSWDMVWLRIDYNARPGFDAFVTDASLARTRVSFEMAAFPKPEQWVHLALSWDETRGIRFYVNGHLAGVQEGTANFDAALDQFGPHSRVISPYQVQSAYNFVRGGDIDELRIYDRMVTDGDVALLAHGDALRAVPALARNLEEPRWRDQWWFRHGWNRPDNPPPPLDAPAVSVRKVEIHDAYDLKRWWWKGTDGIRETTWPGVFNRSRLPGRNDYFQLPDWDCYSLSGQSVTFSMPDEPWNHIEVSGAAFGAFTVGAGGSARPPVSGTPGFERPRGQERTFHRLASPVRGQALTFRNVERETPIGELSAYYVGPGTEPPGRTRLTYRLAAAAQPDQPSLAPLVDFIRGRYQSDLRTTVVALPAGAPRSLRQAPPGGLPLVHVLIPPDFRDVSIDARRNNFSYGWTNISGGLDGIAIDLPALKVNPTHGPYVPLNIQVKDPIWPLRNMLDVSFSVRPGEPHTLWLDTRDRILPNDRGLYLTIAAAASGLDGAALDGAELRLVFKPRSEAAPEHVLDRFTQVRDNYAQIVEERPNSRRLKLYTRFETDITDLLRVDPDHRLGQEYWYDYNKEQPRPPVRLDGPPDGVPLWAFRQLQNLAAVGRFVNWYIDNRQIENGEFGGGLSDDGDLTNQWPSAALMGITPAKIRESLSREMEAFYAQGMFTNGLSTIQTDELHSYEEGIQVLGQSLVLDYGNPRMIERAMETAAAVERLTGVNAAGHRHIRSSYFSGTAISEEGVWGWAKSQSYLILQPAMALVDFNGAPRVRAWLLELADGLLAHRKPDASGASILRSTIEFATDRDLPQPADRALPLLWAAFRWTGDRKYLQPFLDLGPRGLPLITGDALNQLGMRSTSRAAIEALAAAQPASNALRHLAWQATGERRYLEQLYTDQAEAAAVREYINTEGSLWIDRVSVADAELQRARLGGVALVRNAIYPGHAVSWEFQQPGDEQRVAILVPMATPRRVLILACNTDRAPVNARMTGWDLEPGTWRITQGLGSDSGGMLPGGAATRTSEFGRTSDLDIVFAPRAITVIEMELLSRGMPYWSRPDLGISASDVVVTPGTMTVTVHSLGGVDARPSRVALRDRAGRVVATASVPGLRAPRDLKPSTARAVLALSRQADWAGGQVVVEGTDRLPEITRRNNTVALAAVPAGAPSGVPAGNQSAAQASPSPDSSGVPYRNPIIHADYSDPDVIRVGSDYYMVASSFNAVPGLPVLHSTDLVNWHLIGHALPRLLPEEVFATPQHGKGPWAPAIRHHDGKFLVYYPEPDLGIYVVTATNAAGPWSQPVLVKAGKGLIDPCPLWDADGQVYLVHAWARSRAGFANVLTLNRLSPDGLHALDEGRVIINGDRIPGYRTLEGPKLYKHGGYYWVFAPAGGVKNGWQSVFRSRSIDGPYEDRIVLEQGGTDINGPHQGAWIDTPSGEHWFVHFQDLGAYGRIVHLQPMAWRSDGWPVMGTDADGDGKGEPVRAWRRPTAAKPSRGESPATSDEFNDPRLGLQWQWQANPHPDWMSLGARTGWLRLFARPAPSVENFWLTPHLLLQKWPAAAFAATARLSFAPVTEGETAGLMVFGQDYAWIGLRKTAGGLRLMMRAAKEARDGKPDQEAASLDARDGTVYLRVTVTEGGVCRFSVSADDRQYSLIGTAFVARPGVWVGAKVGVFAAAAPGAGKTGHADWDWFRVEPVQSAGRPPARAPASGGGLPLCRSRRPPCRRRPLCRRRPPPLP